MAHLPPSANINSLSWIEQFLCQEWRIDFVRPMPRLFFASRAGRAFFECVEADYSPFLRKTYSPFWSLSKEQYQSSDPASDLAGTFSKTSEFWPFAKRALGAVPKASLLLDHQAQKLFLAGTHKILSRLGEVNLTFHVIHAHAVNFDAALLDKPFRLAARRCECQFH